MITGIDIHNWLQEPLSIKDSNLDQLQLLQEAYPYFSPATLLPHFVKNGSNRNMALEHIFNYNPIIFYYWKDAEIWPNKAKQIDKIKNWYNAQDTVLEHEKDQTVGTEYFKLQGIEVAEDLEAFSQNNDNEKDKSLMVVMSFAEWLHYLQRKTKAEQEEEEEKRALKAQWQKQKMAEAIEEENEEIPANVFEMAVNSISREDGIVSESMAVVYEKQGKIKEAINIYQKLSLNNPDKSIYFANKIENLQKEI